MSAATHRPRAWRWAGAAAALLAALHGPVRADSNRDDRDDSARAGREPVRVLAQRGHVQCPLAGREAQALVLDRPEAAARWLAVDEAQAVGRALDWSRERLLIVALAQQPTLGVQAALDDRLPYAGRRQLQATVRVQRPAPGSMAAMALSRPCVVAVLPRGPWHTVQLRGDARTEGLPAVAARPRRDALPAGQVAPATGTPADVMPLPGR